MTEPVKPKNNITFGGVRFNANDIAKKEKKFNEQGAIRYSVFLKNGISIEYPDQNKKNKSSVDVHGDQVTLIDNLAYGNVKGSPKKDRIFLYGNVGTTVDVSGDNKHDLVSVNDEIIFAGDHKSERNKVVMDSKDSTIFEHRSRKNGNVVIGPKSVLVKGEGTAEESSHMY